MPHTCDTCDEEFATLAALRLHDCPEADDEDDWEQQRDEHLREIRKLEREENEAAKRAASTELTDAIDRTEAGDYTAVYELLGHYERHLSEEWTTYEDDHYDGFHRMFAEPAVAALDEAVAVEGWPFLLDVLDAYWPSVTLDFSSYAAQDGSSSGEKHGYDAFPHISHVLTTVTGKHMVRTRRADGVDAIPTEVLEYQLLFHRHPGDRGAWIRSMSYGWGIGHSEHSVADHIHTLVDGGYDIWATSAIEHAFHADQTAAATLLESVLTEGLAADTDLLLSFLARVERGEYPDRKGYWDWETVYPELADDEFDWDDAIREQLRELVETVEHSYDLGTDWAFTDLEI